MCSRGAQPLREGPTRQDGASVLACSRSPADQFGSTLRDLSPHAARGSQGFQDAEKLQLPIVCPHAAVVSRATGPDLTLSMPHVAPAAASCRARSGGVLCWQTPSSKRRCSSRRHLRRSRTWPTPTSERVPPWPTRGRPAADPSWLGMICAGLQFPSSRRMASRTGRACLDS